MKIGEMVASQKEIAFIVAVIAGLGFTQGATHFVFPQAAPAPVPVVDTSLLHASKVLSQDMSVLATRVSVVNNTVDALVRVACIQNRERWRDFDLAGIHCADVVPSSTHRGNSP